MLGLLQDEDNHDSCTAGAVDQAFPTRVSLYLSPSTFVVGGPRSSIERLELLCATRGVSASRVKVASAFHTACMEPAQSPLRTALEAANIVPLATPVICNVDGAVLDASTPLAEIRERLLQQLTEPVRWRESMETAMAMCGSGRQVVLMELVAGEGSGLKRFAFETANATPGSAAIPASFKLGAISTTVLRPTA